MADKVAAIKKWAHEWYAQSYGASAIIETMIDSEIDATFESLQDAKDWARLMDEMYQNAQP